MDARKEACVGPEVRASLAGAPGSQAPQVWRGKRMGAAGEGRSGPWQGWRQGSCGGVLDPSRGAEPGVAWKPEMVFLLRNLEKVTSLSRSLSYTSVK